MMVGKSASIGLQREERTITQKVKKMKDHETRTPVVIIGAGPVGVTAAAQMLARGLTPILGPVTS